MNQSIYSTENSVFRIGGMRANYVLVICSLIWMTSFMVRQVLTVVLESVKQDLALTDAQAGLITSLLFVSMALFAIPVSYLSDMWSRKKMLSIMAFFWSVCTLLTGFADSFFTVALARFLTGIGVAGVSSAAMSLISASFPEEVRAKKLGIFNLFQAVGIGISLVLGGYLSVKFGGWRSPFYFFAVPGFVVGLLALFMQDYPNSELKHGSGAKEGFVSNLKSLLKIPTVLWFYAGYTMVIIVTFAVLSWVPALIIRNFSVNEDVAGVIMGITGIFTIPGTIAGGYLADAWQKKYPSGRLRFAALMSLLSMLTLNAALLCITIFYKTGSELFNLWIITGSIMTALFFMILSAITPAVMAATQSVVNRKQKNLVWGVCLFVVMVFGGAWAPAVTGYISDSLGGDTYGLSRALMFISFAGGAGFLLLWKSSMHYAEDAGNVKSNDQ